MAFLAAIPAAIGSLAGGTGIGLGSLLSAAGGIVTGIAGYQAARYQAKVAEQNAALAYDNAARATEQAQKEVVKHDQEIAAFVGQQEAAQSASGLSTKGRSQVLTRRSAQRIGRLESAAITEQGAANARNFFQQEADYKSQAKQAKAQGTMSLISGFLSAGSSLVGGAAPVSSQTAKQFRGTPLLASKGSVNRLRVNTI